VVLNNKNNALDAKKLTSAYIKNAVYYGLTNLEKYYQAFEEIIIELPSQCKKHEVDNFCQLTLPFFINNLKKEYHDYLCTEGIISIQDEPCSFLKIQGNFVIIKNNNQEIREIINLNTPSAIKARNTTKILKRKFDNTITYNIIEFLYGSREAEAVCLYLKENFSKIKEI
jgi:hypothetical protein